jgi:transcriptional regulator with XRE-family HTH domain
MRKPPVKQPIDPVVQRRLDVLELLIDKEYGESVKRFEHSTGIKMVQVSQWFSGYRALRDKALRRLEEATGKPQGYFDGQAEGETTARWPFRTIAIERYQALSERQQGWLEGKLDALIERCEADVVDADEAVLQRRTVAEGQDRTHKDKENP